MNILDVSRLNRDGNYNATESCAVKAAFKVLSGKPVILYSQTIIRY